MTFYETSIVFAFLFGLIFGSFLNVCIYRIPRKKSLIMPSSSCPHCGERIRFYDNIPLVSYLILFGKCRHCRTKIPVRYPIVELITGLLSLFLFIRYDISIYSVSIFLFSASLVVITFIDLYHQIIPDVISIPGMIVGLAISFLPGHVGWLDSIIGILAGGGGLYLVAVLFEKLTGKEGMGGGDVKLLGMIGAWMGWKALPFVILFSSLLGTIVGGGALLIYRRGLQTRIPFGPFLALGALAYLFFGDELLAWYYGILS
ncbi:MAG: prepilin peptidase [Deltaproteobacteria bacterium]|nr:prepilin peptidase [Deltaproteobacteria bacterium]